MTAYRGEEARGRKNDSPARRRLLAAATLTVLGTVGSRGLTHRAVDSAAGLAPGSINYFVSTREQLLTLALEELFEHDLTLSTSISYDSALTRPDLEAGMLHLIREMTTPAGRLRHAARSELLLEAQRRPNFLASFSRQRDAFVNLAASALSTSGCGDPPFHSDILVAFIDALIARQLLMPSPLSDGELVAAIHAHLIGC